MRNATKDKDGAMLHPSNRFCDFVCLTFVPMSRLKTQDSSKPSFIESIDELLQGTGPLEQSCT